MLLKKLIEILKTFDKDELKKFKRFIGSDYFNTNESICRLLKLIIKFYPKFDVNEKGLTSEILFKGVYGTRKYDEKTLRYLISSLYSLTEKFIGLSIIENDELEMRKNVIDSMIERRLFNMADKNLIAAETSLEENNLIGGEYIYNKIDYATLRHQLYFLSNRQVPILDKRIEQGEYHIYGAIAEMVHNYQIILTVAGSYNLELEDNLLYTFVRNINYPEIISNITSLEAQGKVNPGNDKLYKTVKIYLCFFATMLNEKDELYFDMMNRLVEEHGHLFGRAELQNLHIMLTTCCPYKRKAINEEKYLGIYFDVIKRAVSKDLYTSYTSQYMDVTNFILIFKTALQLGENDWAAEFLRNYGERISPEYSEDMINYAFAELFFTKKDFDRSLGSLSKVKAKLFRLKVPVRVLMLRLYYELNYFEEAFSLIDSFTRFLSANAGIKAEEKNNQYKFLNFYKQLLKVKANGTKIEPELKDELQSSSLLQHKAWLVEKADELKANAS